MRISKLLGLNLAWLRMIINDSARGEGVFGQSLSRYVGLYTREADILSVVLQVEHELESGKRLADIEYEAWERSRQDYLRSMGYPQWRLSHVHVVAGLIGTMFECVTNLYYKRDRKRICKAYRNEFLESAYVLQSDRRFNDAAAMALAHYLVVRNTSLSFVPHDKKAVAEALWTFRQFWGARSTRLYDVGNNAEDAWPLAA